MSRSLPTAPRAADFRALAQSSPWRFTTVHFTHQGQRGAGAEAGGTVEAWLDRGRSRLTVRSRGGVQVETRVPYSVSGLHPAERGEPELRPDGLVVTRPPGWHFRYGDPMWRDYQWTAMLDPAELSLGVQVDDVTVTAVRGRATWTAACRPLMGEGEEWIGGYDPRCGCCPLLDSAVSRLIEYGPDSAMSGTDLPTTYRVQLDVQTAIVVQIDAIDGDAGTVLSNEIHAVDRPLTPARS